MIYLMRHGADDPDRLGGWSPYGLTDIGRQQALDAAERIINVGITAIYSSDLPRAKETAEIVAKTLVCLFRSCLLSGKPTTDFLPEC